MIIRILGKFYKNLGTSKMAEREKVLVAKCDDLSSIPGTHVMEGENQLLQSVLYAEPWQCAHMHAHTRAHTHSLNK